MSNMIVMDHVIHNVKVTYLSHATLVATCMVNSTFVFHKSDDLIKSACTK